ncbi:hypothetical protein P5G61_12385 [Paenibacillus sp. F6_3S_P_1C]|uniref:DUF2479 domain-containing protein n=1 Tax=Paenibacillus vandeheii TaxID=3035917 RepID=A0ABT8JBZ1_9BACL|nr:hypothetical protein [Paenibacillus vandeheii]MDN4602027.1 hypothetical protein [Paenibacillus vandeheii]
MAGTRGIARFRGEQLNNKLMRNNHFDVNNKINEQYVDIDFNAHREILEDTKIDVFVQKNGAAVGAGVNFIEISNDILNTNVAVDSNTEGTVVGVAIQLRKNGTEDFPFIDEDGDRVYGKVRETAGKYFLDFFSEVNGAEAAYTFTEAVTIDFKYITRTNLSVIPVDAIVSGGAGLVADAVDAKAYMNLNQLMKDIYGGSGTLDNDGNANLATNIVQQIANEIQARTDADTAIRNDLASTAATKGASLVGVVVDPNYDGVNVQSVLANLAQRVVDVETLNAGIADRDADSVNGYFKAGDFGTAKGRIVDLETVADAEFKAQNDRLVKLETEDEEEVFEATGGETEYVFVNGLAKPKTVLLFINGQVQAPSINFDYLLDGNGAVRGVDFSPETLKVTDGIPDVLFVKYKKIL